MMLKQSIFFLLCTVLLLSYCTTKQQVPVAESLDPQPFPGERGRGLDSYALSTVWNNDDEGFFADFVKVPRHKVVAFALYTHDQGKLKMTAQLFPLKDGEPMETRLELKEEEGWKEVHRSAVVYPGWSSHFEIDNWDNTRDVPYRVLHGDSASFEGLIRKDPVDKPEIVVASLSCNSNQDRNPRNEIVQKLIQQNPDLLFFAGDQSYDHKQHTAAWLVWGTQFRDVLRDRPVVTIPDDHDIGQGNFWGEGGIVADSTTGDSGGYYYPPEYINMVQRSQTWHLPDPVDPEPVQQGISVYFTRLRVGGVDFAILEDRKFKSGPKGKIPQMGPRPDHIQEEGYDPDRIDLPGLHLLGDRQLSFLDQWGQDWTGAEMKAVLSQTAFCGAVHLHGSKENRLLADLDCNGWPQSGRNAALSAMRKALATHLCGDQHLAVVVKHGIEEFRDGPFAFTNPATVNTYYGRWWWPEDEKAGGGESIRSTLPWTGDYFDGLYNKITMHAYANPDFPDMKAMRDTLERSEVNLGDGYGLIRFNKQSRQITFECWPRFADLSKGDQAQYPGWPVSFAMAANDGRKVYAYLPELHFDMEDPVVQIVTEGGEVLYTHRIQGKVFRPHVFAGGTYVVKAGKDTPTEWSSERLEVQKSTDESINVRF
jgi:hypothetical protein